MCETTINKLIFITLKLSQITLNTSSALRINYKSILASAQKQEEEEEEKGPTGLTNREGTKASPRTRYKIRDGLTFIHHWRHSSLFDGLGGGSSMAHLVVWPTACPSPLPSPHASSSPSWPQPRSSEGSSSPCPRRPSTDHGSTQRCCTSLQHHIGDGIRGGGRSGGTRVVLSGVHSAVFLYSSATHWHFHGHGQRGSSHCSVRNHGRPPP